MAGAKRSVQQIVPAEGWCAVAAGKRVPLVCWAVTRIDAEFSRVFGMVAKTDDENGLSFADRLEGFEKYDRLGKKEL